MLFLLLATTSMRRGEVVGLRWTHVDLHREMLSVVHTVSTMKGERIFGEPKTARSRRNVYLDTATVTELRAHRARQKEAALSAGEAWTNELGLVFTDELGGVLHPDYVTRDFDRRIERLGLPRIRLHDYADLRVMSTSAQRRCCVS